MGHGTGTVSGKTPLAVEAGKIFAVALGCMAAVLIQSDYDYIGIIIIAAFMSFITAGQGAVWQRQSLAAWKHWI